MYWNGGARLTGHLWVVRLRLWVLAVLFFGIGDLVTTGIGLTIDGVVEASPVAAPLLSGYGIGALVGLKLVVLGGGYLLWRVIPRPYCMGVPVALTVLGVAVTGWNLGVVAISLNWGVSL